MGPETTPAGRPRRGRWLALALIAAAALGSFVAGRGGLAPATMPGPATPAEPSDVGAATDGPEASALAVANGQLQLADAALEVGDPALMRQAIATARAVVAEHDLSGATADLAAAFERFAAAEDAAAAGDLDVARAAFGTAEARFADALGGGALPGIVEPAHLYAGAGIRHVDGRATLAAGDAAGAVPLLRDAESRRGPAYRPALETAVAAAATPTTPRP